MVDKDQREAFREASRIQQEKEREAFLLTVPKRLMNATALGQSLGVIIDIGLNETGPTIHMHYNHDGLYIDDIFTYEADEWKLQTLENNLQLLKEIKEVIKKRRELAEKIWEGLNKEERIALKENIENLRSTCS